MACHRRVGGGGGGNDPKRGNLAVKRVREGLGKRGPRGVLGESVSRIGKSH